MSETKFTKGEWKVTGDFQDKIVDSEYKIIASTNTVGRERSENKANAELICLAVNKYLAEQNEEIKVAEIINRNDEIFYTDDLSNLKKYKDCEVTFLKMTRGEYQNIPATQNAKEFFGDK